MGVNAYTQDILTELLHNTDLLHDQEFEELAEAIRTAHHIFLSGKGRSGLAISAFANRLMHLGFSVSLIGEITAPHTAEGDLLIIGSGSGETESLVSLAQKAKKQGISVALVTMNSRSALAKLADVCVELPGVSPKTRNSEASIASIQPMGSAFEQMLLLSCDGMILRLMELTNQTSEEMFKRHADLE